MWFNGSEVRILPAIGGNIFNFTGAAYNLDGEVVVELEKE